MKIQGAVKAEQRILKIYSELIKGKIICKSSEANFYNVSLKSIQRDIEKIRNFLGEEFIESGIEQKVVYDRKLGGYRLENKLNNILSNDEAFAVIKILLESRALVKKELEVIINKITLGCIDRNNKKKFVDLIKNEQFHYVEPQHKTKIINNMWKIGTAINEHRLLKIKYQRKDQNMVVREIKPLAIIFSEFYFYLVAIINDEGMDFINTEMYPTIYRIDRIKKFQILDEHFKVPYENRFEEGEFRKRVQFMYSGSLRKVKFYYTGESIEAVLDRLPTAKAIMQETGTYLVTAEVYGHGIDMWLKSQGNKVEVVE